MDEQKLEDFLKRSLSNMYFTLENYRDWQDPLACKKHVKEIKMANAVDPVDIKITSDNLKKKNILLTEKYKPVTSSDLVGNKG